MAPSGPASALTADRPQPLLQVSQLQARWANGQVPVDRCDLKIDRPGLWMLVGGNGSGKSTLLRLLAGLLEPCGGTIAIAGRAALVFQNPDHQLLLPSCGSDLELWLAAGLSPEARRERIRTALAQVGLAGFEGRPIHTLSGGQKQRLAIAGALASGAELLLLDEPTALLDPTSQAEILALLVALTHRQEQPLAALWVTHRLEELQQCDGAALMQDGRCGPWQQGATLRTQLERGRALPGGRGKR